MSFAILTVTPQATFHSNIAPLKDLWRHRKKFFSHKRT